MTTIDNIMALHNAASHAAVQYALLAQVSLRSERTLQAAADRDEAKEALRTALTEALVAQPVRESLTDRVKNELELAKHIYDMFVSEYGFSSPMAKDMKVVRDSLMMAHGIGGDK